MIKHNLVLASLCLLLNGIFSIKSFGQCDFRRADIATLDAGQQSQLCSLIMEYLKDGVDVNDPAINSVNDYPVVADHNVNFGSIHFTGTPVFLTWHRAYIQQLENWLVDRGFTDFSPSLIGIHTTTFQMSFLMMQTTMVSMLYCHKQTGFNNLLIRLQISLLDCSTNFKLLPFAVILVV